MFEILFLSVNSFILLIWCAINIFLNVFSADSNLDLLLPNLE